MISIEFPCTPRIQDFVREIAATMVHLFDISLDEAAGRINRFWRGKSALEEQDEVILLHKTPEHWAKTIYYGSGVMWWLGEEGLAPKPFP